MRLTRAALLVFSCAGCGGRVEGTAAAPAGTLVTVYAKKDADEYARSISGYNQSIRDSIAAGRARGLDEPTAQLNAANAPWTPPGSAAAVQPLGTGAVGVGGRLAIEGHFRGSVAVVIDEPVWYGIAGCRVDAEMPTFGTKTVTMAWDQCHLWTLPTPIDVEQLKRVVSMRLREDSTSRANLAAVMGRPWIADRDGMYYFAARSPCAQKIPMNRRIFLRDSAHAHLEGYGRSQEPGC